MGLLKDASGGFYARDASGSKEGSVVALGFHAHNHGILSCACVMQTRK